MMKRMLSAPWKRLVGMMQTLNFGRTIFLVRAGEPDFTQKVRTVRTRKPSAGENGPRLEVAATDFELRKEVMFLRDQVATATDGACVTIEVRHGLPFLIEIEEEHQA
jgi:hypothetical protein